MAMTESKSRKPRQKNRKVQRTSPSVTPDRLKLLRDQLLTGLVERDVAIRLAFLALLSGEHLLLLGPPGTAKSLIARRLHLICAEGTSFERLLTRYTVPEELFGPLSINGLQQDRYERLTEGYLPTASIGFLDEIFKANSAILNALLTLLNEREFDNGTQRMQCPLLTVVGASNELPDNADLDALYDRFLLRLHVGPVSSQGFRELLELDNSQPKIDPAMRLTPKEIMDVQEMAKTIDVPDDVLTLLASLREWCQAQGLQISDRRWRKLRKMLQVAALTNGRKTVSIWDCWLLQHGLWNIPEQRQRLHEWYAKRVGATRAMDPSHLTRVVVVWEGTLKADQDSRSQKQNAQGKLQYLNDNGRLSTTKIVRLQLERPGQAGTPGKPLFFAPIGAIDQYGHQINRSKDGGYTEEDLSQMRVGQTWFSRWAGRVAYLKNPKNRLTREKELPPAMEPTRHKPAYVEQCLQEINRLKADTEQYKNQLTHHVASLEHDIRSHLWVTDDFVEPASQALEETQKTVALLLSRIENITSGFEQLPRDINTDDDKTRKRRRAIATPKATTKARART